MLQLSSIQQHFLFSSLVLVSLLQLSEQDLLGVAAAGRLLMARPYGSRMNHSQGLASAMAAAQVCYSRKSFATPVGRCGCCC
jgi:hypothetical protein